MKISSVKRIVCLWYKSTACNEPCCAAEIFLLLPRFTRANDSTVHKLQCWYTTGDVVQLLNTGADIVWYRKKNTGTDKVQYHNKYWSDTSWYYNITQDFIIENNQIYILMISARHCCCYALYYYVRNKKNISTMSEFLLTFMTNTS